MVLEKQRYWKQQQLRQEHCFMVSMVWRITE